MDKNPNGEQARSPVPQAVANPAMRRSVSDYPLSLRMAAEGLGLIPKPPAQ